MPKTDDHIKILNEIIGDLEAMGKTKSLREVALFLNTNSGTLTQVLSNKRNLPISLFREIVKQLELNEFQKVMLASGLSGPSYREIKAELDLSFDFDEEAEKDHLTYQILSKWHHFSFLSLMQTKSFNPEVAWISKRLGITKTTVKEVLENLKKLNLIKEKNKTLIRTNVDLESKTEVFETANHKGYIEEIKKIKDNLMSDEKDNKGFSSITIPISSELTEELFALTDKYLDQVEALSRKSKPDEVFTINVQFYPVTKPVSE